MIEPILGLSFNLQAHKGTFALLLGSGVSRSADIPTGWEVTLDLVRQLAHMSGDSCDDNEAEWYEGKYGKAPDYSTLLAEIAPTSAAQQQVLRGYFEADEEAREEGRRVPTAAHKAIAQLVASGHIRVIVTTNFDRLIVWIGSGTAIGNVTKQVKLVCRNRRETNPIDAEKRRISREIGHRRVAHPKTGNASQNLKSVPEGSCLLRRGVARPCDEQMHKPFSGRFNLGNGIAERLGWRHVAPLIEDAFNRRTCGRRLIGQ
jgi:hypothetical protein